jgi:type III secretion system FlhB-like substrate exporter
MRAPQVVSKGADLLAFKIRDIAKHHAIPVLQSPMLARALYANAELDKDIPASLYTAVAQVLAYIYRLKAAMRGDGDSTNEVDIPPRSGLDKAERSAPSEVICPTPASCCSSSPRATASTTR